MKRKAQSIVIEAVLVSLTLVMLAWVFVPRFLESQNINTPENFPDPVVRAAVETFMGVEPGGYFTQRQAREKTGELELSPNANVTYLNPNQYIFAHHKDGIETPINPISNLSGLHYFQSISGFSFVADHLITDVNLSHHSQLQTINIWGGNIHSSSFEVCSDLVNLKLTFGKWKELDISNNPQLRSLYVSHNQLDQLNTDHNPELRFLFCSNNHIEEINLSNNRNIRTLSINNNTIRSIDVTQCPKITQIDIANNPITKIDLSKQDKLIILTIDEKQLFHSEIIIHSSATPRIDLKSEKGYNKPMGYYPLKKQQAIQAQINRILNQSKASQIDSTQNETSP